MGPDRFRFLCPLPACAPVQLKEIPANSFAKTNLLLSPTRRRIYQDNSSNLNGMKNLQKVGEGRGVTPTHSVPLRKSARVASTQLPATSDQLPLVSSAVPRQLLH